MTTTTSMMDRAEWEARVAYDVAVASARRAVGDDYSHIARAVYRASLRAAEAKYYAAIDAARARHRAK